MFESLSEIAGIKSVLREETESYFRQVVTELDTTELYLNGEVIKISDIAVEPQVITTERVIENPKIFEPGAADGAKSGFETRGDAYADMVAENYERVSQSEKYRQISWKQALTKKNLRLAVKGEPGGGKSFMTKFTAIEIAQESLRKLDSFETVIEDVEFPIWLTANELAEFRRRDTIEQSLIELEKGKTPKLSEKFWARFGRQINMASIEALPKFFVFVDGLDELYDENFQSFSAASQKLYNFPARVVAACRRFQWKGMQGLLKWNKFTEVTLAPFGIAEQKRVIDKFFSHQPELKSSLRKLAESNYALRNAFSSPLLLTFACLLHQTGDLDENTTHINLYELMLDNLFNGTYCPADRKPNWMRRKANDRSNSNDRITMLKALFDEIGWQLFQKNPAAKEFELKDWNVAFNKAIKVVKRSYLQINKITDSLEFRNELMKIRLILMTNNQRGKEKWYYLHRTLLEFASARALAEREDWLWEAKKHFWDSAWLEQLTFLAGLLEVEDTRQLIAAVRAEDNDIFGSMTFLEAKFTGASELFDTIDIIDICDRIIYALADDYWGHRVFRIDEAFRQRLRHSHFYKGLARPAHLTLELNEQCRRYFYERLISPILSTLTDKSNDNELRRTAAYELVELRVDNTAVIEALTQVLIDQSNDELLRVVAADAIGNLGVESATAVEFLIQFLRDEYIHVGLRVYSIHALVKLGAGNEELDLELLQILRDTNNDYWFRVSAAKALVSSGVESEEIVSELWQVPDHNSNQVWSLNDIARPLIEFGTSNEEVVSKLGQILHNNSNHEWLRIQAIRSLVELNTGSEQAILELLQILSSKFNSVDLRSEVAEALVTLCLKNKPDDDRLQQITEVIYANLNIGYYVLGSNFATSLWKIWQILLKSQPDFKITRKFFEQ